MTEVTAATIGRSPAQIMELQLPRCANDFGCGQCEAGLGNVAVCDLTQNFALNGAGDFSAVNATLTRVAGGIKIEATASNSRIIADNVTTGFDGDDFRYVVIHGTYTAGNLNDWWLLYGSPGGGGPSSGDRQVKALNYQTPFRGQQLDSLKPGDQFIAIFDAADSTNYATDWQGETVDGFRFDMGSDASNDFTVHAITVCSENLFHSAGRECFRTRSTCQDVPNFLSIPAGSQEPDNTLTKGQLFDGSDLSGRDGNAFFVLHNVSFPAAPSGVLLHVAGAADAAVYLGFSATDLVFRAGDSTAASGVDTAKGTVPIATVAGRTVSLILEIDDDQFEISLWEFCVCTRTLSLLGTASASGADWGGSVWAGTASSGAGVNNGDVATGEASGAFNGGFVEIEYFEARHFPHSAEAFSEFGSFEYYSRADLDLPSDRDKVFMPFLRDVTTAPSKVSLAGSNRNADPLGNRSSVQVSLTDQPGTDLAVDPYFVGRFSNGLDAPGSYWAKWRVRQQIGRVDARIKIYEGYAGQALSDMLTREYVFDKIDVASRASVGIRGRDILSKAELKKAQVPVQSPGALAVALGTTDDTLIVVKGGDLTDYPASGGTVRIDKEIITYSAAALNASNQVELTILARGQDRSDEATHDVDDGVQLCRRYTAENVINVITDLLANDARIPGQNLDLSNWVAEGELYFSAYNTTTLITEPTAVSVLLGELMEAIGGFVFWDERAQLVRLRAIRALNEFPPTLDDVRNILADTFSVMEKPDEQATRVQIYYNPISFAEKNDKPVNYLNGYVDAQPALERQDALGRRQIRTILTRWLNTNAQATQTASRLASRYEEVPTEVTFELDAKDGVDYWTGDYIRLDHFQIVDEFGARKVDRNFIITSAEEYQPGEKVRYTAEDTTLVGFQSLIAPNAQGDYSGDPDTDLFYGFITDDDGLNADGTEGSRIT